MDSAAFGPFPGSLDPYAAEFRPSSQTVPPQQQQQQQQQLFCLPYPTPPPFLPYTQVVLPPPPPPHLITTTSPPPPSHFNYHPVHFNPPPSHFSSNLVSPQFSNRNSQQAHLVSNTIPPQSCFSNSYSTCSSNMINSPPLEHFISNNNNSINSPNMPFSNNNSPQVHFSSNNLPQARFSDNNNYSPQAHFSNNSPKTRFTRNNSTNTHKDHLIIPSEATRTLLLTNMPRGASETDVRRELESFGDVRAVEMERIRRDGIVTVHFYDIRQAIMVLREIHMQNNRESRGPAVLGGDVWAKFVMPNMAGLPDGYNQGTLVLFHLNPEFDTNTLIQLFAPFGDVKELRDTPTKRHQRFVEFYDVRDAAKAYSQLKGKEIFGSQIVIEFSRPGGNKKHLHKDISKNPNTRTQNQPRSLSITRQNSNNSQARKPSSQGSTSGSEKCSPNENLKKGNQVSSGNSKINSKNKGWSHRARRKCLDSRFLINEDGIVDSNVSDSRTTVMIKNIPNKYSQKLLINMLDNHCIHCNDEIATSGCDEPLSSYDFVYLPIDFMNKCNVGYGFVNMTSPVAALRLYKAFHHQSWEVYNSKKICDVTYARLQGLDALKEHFRNSKFPCDADEYLPVVFSPPRDGREITNPLPIARGHLFSSSNNKEEEEDKSISSHQTLTDDDGDDPSGTDLSQ